RLHTLFPAGWTLSVPRWDRGREDDVPSAQGADAPEGAGAGRAGRADRGGRTADEEVTAGPLRVDGRGARSPAALRRRWLAASGSELGAGSAAVSVAAGHGEHPAASVEGRHPSAGQRLGPRAGEPRRTAGRRASASDTAGRQRRCERPAGGLASEP